MAARFRTALESTLLVCGPWVYRLSLLLFFVAMAVGVIHSCASDRRLPPAYIDYHSETYETVIERRDYRRGIPQLRMAARLDFYGHRPKHDFELAKASYRAGDSNNLHFAVQELERIVREGYADRQGRVFYYLSVALTLQSVVDRKTRMRAVELAEEALRHDPKHAAGHSHLGLNWLYLGENKKAFVCFSRALKIDPSLRQARQGMDYYNQRVKANQ